MSDEHTSPDGPGHSATAITRRSAELVVGGIIAAFGLTAIISPVFCQERTTEKPCNRLFKSSMRKSDQ
jgi:hypothetical protein